MTQSRSRYLCQYIAASILELHSVYEGVHIKSDQLAFKYPHAKLNDC